MAFTTKKLMAEIKMNRQGIIIGAVTGAMAANYAISQGIADPMQIIDAGKGLLDSTLGRSAAPVQLATYKIYGVFMTIGAFMGILASKIVSKF